MSVRGGGSERMREDVSEGMLHGVLEDVSEVGCVSEDMSKGVHGTYLTSGLLGRMRGWLFRRLYRGLLGR